VITPLMDGVGLLGPLDELFPDMSEDDWAPYRDRYPDLVSGNDWRLPIMCFLVRASGQTILVDTGAGPEDMWEDWMVKPESQEGLLRKLEPADVDIVFLTHDHIDHVGWNVLDDGSAAFPNARYVMHEDALATARRTADRRPFVQRCVLALEMETVRGGQEIAPGVEVVELPGHAPGHSGLLVGDDSVIVADAVPHPAQLDHPEWRFSYDDDPDLAAETRRRIVTDYGDREVWISHYTRGWRR
jgi:glyoxylase-like metal-dependent hydrolase (beta-lactamase superfamily II)